MKDFIFLLPITIIVYIIVKIAMDAKSFKD
jgi:phage shock protein PspC (stress-responsive transcriptional regulator)